MEAKDGQSVARKHSWKNDDDLDWRTAGRPVLRGRSQCGSLWRLRRLMGVLYVGDMGYYVRNLAVATDRTQSGLSSFPFFFLMNVN